MKSQTTYICHINLLNQLFSNKIWAIVKKISSLMLVGLLILKQYYQQTKQYVSLLLRLGPKVEI